MITTSTDAVVAEYLAGVRAELADLPAAEVEEILEDIGAHLAEVAAEFGEDVSVDTLTERLGTPEQYASELRTAAGYPAAHTVGSGPIGWAAIGYRLALLALLAGWVTALVFGLLMETLVVHRSTPIVALVFAIPLAAGVLGRRLPGVGELPEMAAARRAGRGLVATLPATAVTYLRALRQAWWLVRLVVLAVAAVTLMRFDKLWLPTVVGLILLLWLGSWSAAGRRWQWLLAIANAFAIGASGALLMWVSLPGPHSHDATAMYDYSSSSRLAYNSQPVWNIYVFDKDGKYVPQAHLYDGRGNPLRVLVYGCRNSDQRLNTFPLPEANYDLDGNCQEAVPGAPSFSVVIPTPQQQPGK
jgi:uncharacterized membrane protein